MKFLLKILLCFFAVPLFAQEFIERQMSETSSEAVNPVEAKKEISDKIIRKISEEVIIELIGLEKYNQSKSVIESKILSQSPRYVAYQKNSEVQIEGEKLFKMSSQIKISVEALKNILNSQGLVGQASGNPIIVPFIEFIQTDSSNRYAWWEIDSSESQKKNVLSPQAVRVENMMAEASLKEGLYLFCPIERKFFELKHNISGRNQFLDFAKSKNASIYMMGKIIQSEMLGARGRSKLEIKFQVFPISTGRMMTEFVRNLEVDKGKEMAALQSTVSELFNQISESWQKGTAGALYLNLVFKTHLNPKMQELVKERIKSQVVQIRSMRERLVTGQSMIFELGTQSDVPTILSKLNGLEIQGQKLLVTQGSETELVAELKEKQ